MLHDTLPDPLHNQRQPVAADMRMGVHQNRGIGAEGHQLVQHFADVAPLVGARKELAVREGAGAALPETVVRIGVDAAGRRKGGDIGFAGVNVHTALQNHGFASLHQEPQRSEHSGGAAAHHNHRFSGSNVLVFRKFVFRQRFLSDGRSRYAVTIEDIAPGIQRAPQDAHLRHAGRRTAQRTRRSCREFGLRRRMPDGEGDLELFHRSPYSAEREIGAISSGAKRPR